MSRRTIKLTSREARQRAHALIDAAPEGYLVTVAEPYRYPSGKCQQFGTALPCFDCLTHYAQSGRCPERANG